MAQGDDLCRVMRALRVDHDSDDNAQHHSTIFFSDHSLHGGGVEGPTPHFRGLCSALSTTNVCSHLRHLGLRDCALDDGGAALLATTLVSSRLELWSIDLGVNSIGTQGIIALASEMNRMPSLEWIYLNEQRCRRIHVETKHGKQKRRWRWIGNMEIGTDAMKELLRAIRCHEQPLRISLSQVRVDLATVSPSHRVRYLHLFEVQVIFHRLGLLPSGIIAYHLGRLDWLSYATQTLRMLQ